MRGYRRGGAFVVFEMRLSQYFVIEYFFSSIPFLYAMLYRIYSFCFFFFARYIPQSGSDFHDQYTDAFMMENAGASNARLTLSKRWSMDNVMHLVRSSKCALASG